MERYHITKRMNKLLSSLSHYLEGKVMTDEQIRYIVSELESLVRISEANGKMNLVPCKILTRINFFLEAFKHHAGIENSCDPDVMGIEDMKSFLSNELGINTNKDYVFLPKNRPAMPVQMLFI